jgi:indolepyruvate ferredoxin oxidoreductase beta subunit
MTPIARPVSILIAALGGEGGGVLTEWLVTAARRAGYAAQSTSIPGVAQRTGATTYYVEIYPVPIADLGDRLPVLGLLPVPGRIDLVVASELLEAVRVVQSGMTGPDRTLLITSTSRTLTTAEKMSLGDGRFDSALLLEVARKHSRELIAFDLAAAARDAGTVVSAAMFGAIAASGALPFGREVCAAAIEGTDRAADASRAGFARACSELDAKRGPHEEAPAKPEVAIPRVPEAIRATFPASTHEIIALGRDRVDAFQNREYADLYVDRLKRILAAERVADPRGSKGFALTRETARFLALWMAFDDVVRVADLKCRASRFVRVRSEVAAGGADIVRITDYLKPGLPEAAGLLPRRLAARLAAWERRRQALGKPPFALALTLRADSVTGFLALRTLASMRWLRRHGARYVEEQSGIERWLSAIVAAATLDWQLAHEIALSARLVKGYGATNERGKANLLHILTHLAAPSSAENAGARAQAIRDARHAALADEGGNALDAALATHGAPPRPVKPQPIRWTKSRARVHDKAGETVS